uniref:neurexin-1-like n=1 Tax=Nyctereutes procyonoides TaxID=34880 RepID=UPI002443DA1F|nr:neurexin-1-like [Nyctereutes procyonoides]
MGTALLQRGGCFLLCLSLLLLGCWAELGSGLEFPGAEGQWTRFPKWNACCESEMSFQLKTRSARGLVLYFDDEGFCDFLELILTRGGRLQLSFSIFCAEPATLLADTPVNDGAWHSVRIRRQFRNTTLFIDQAEAKWVEVKSKRRDMTVFSGLFVGGLPPELRAAALKLTLAAVREREPFRGWIRDVRVNASQALPLDSGDVKLDDEPPNSGGGSPCEAGDEGEGGVCLNGGVCSVVDDQAVCDCSRTGFRGKDCSQEDNNVEGLAHLMMGDQGIFLILKFSEFSCALNLNLNWDKRSQIFTFTFVSSSRETSLLEKAHEHEPGNKEPSKQVFKIESQELPSTGLNRDSEHLGLSALTSQKPVTAEESAGGPLDRCVEIRIQFITEVFFSKEPSMASSVHLANLGMHTEDQTEGKSPKARGESGREDESICILWKPDEQMVLLTFCYES